MKNLNLTLSLLLIIFIATSAIAQKQNKQAKIDSLETKVIEVEKKLSSREKELVELQKNLNLIHEKVNDAKELAFKTNRDLFKEKFGFLAGGFTLVSAILGFLLALYGLREFMRNKTKEHLNKYLKSIEWTKALNAKIQKQIAENKFKEEVKLLILSNDDNSENVIMNYFEENDFPKKNIIYQKGANGDFLNRQFDLLFINNMNDSFQMINKPLDSLIAKIKENNKNLVVFYFNDTGIQLPRDLNEGLNNSFSSSLAATYHNLLDLMRYKYLVIDRKNL